MPLQTQGSALAPQDAYGLIRGLAFAARAQAQNYLLSLQNGSVDSNFIFRFLDQVASFISSINTWKAVAGLDSYATAQNYTGTMSADCTASVNAAAACRDWVVNNWPKDSTNTWILAESLNADGSRTPRLFTPAQTAGLQTNLQTFINSIA